MLFYFNELIWSKFE